MYGIHLNRQAEALIGLIAEGQHGAFTTAQALAAGLTPMQLKRLVKSGVYVRLFPRVLGVAGTPKSWERQAAAALMWAGEESALSHTSAARGWRLDGFPSQTLIHISTTRRPKPPSGIRVHCCDRNLTSHIAQLGPLRLTSAPRTVMDLAGMKHPKAEKALDQCLRERLASLDQFWALYEDEWLRGRRGVGILRQLLIERTKGAGPGDSDLESLMWKIVQAFGLPLPTPQHPTRLLDRTVRLDFAYPAELLAIECDGYAWHMDREAFERDRIRDNELQALGWTVLRFTWSRLKWQQKEVAGEIGRHLELRRAQLKSSAKFGVI